ncbi:MAG: hypothetical protein GEU91_07605 [Rhizobiales bacterium]|nr:hypothetical protein [Hyphomicrobiales bacterium]
MVRSSALWLFAAIILFASFPTGAADIYESGPAAAPIIAEDAPIAATGMRTRTTPLVPAPQIRYGCRRIWRCDTTVCEWRRGCWGVYGYVESTYYSAALARRQWESHGLPAYPQERRRR